MKTIKAKEQDGNLVPESKLPNGERIFDGTNYYCKEGENDPKFELKKQEILSKTNPDEK